MDSPILIIDLGYGTVRAGMNTSNAPTVSITADAHWYDSLSTEENFKSIFSQVISKLTPTPSACRVMVTQPVDATPVVRTQMTNVLMRDFKVEAMYISSHLFSALCSATETGSGTAVFYENGQMNVNTYKDGYPLRNRRCSGADLGFLGVNIVETILACDIPLQQEMFNSIYLFGAQFGAAQKAEVESSVNRNLPNQFASCKVTLPVEQDGNAVWRGAKAFAAMDLSGLWFTQADYQAGGASSINKKTNF